MTTGHISTNDLETLARELFNGALPKLPVDESKRRALLAREFASAHLTVLGVSRPDATKLAALETPFRAIAANRQARVNSFLAALPQPVSHKSLREKLVIAMGEQALQLKLHNARHAIAAAMVLLEKLEGRESKLDLIANHAADGGLKFLDRLEAAYGGSGASAKILPHGPLRVSAMTDLLDGLADALAEGKAASKISRAPAGDKQPSKPASTAASLAPAAPSITTQQLEALAVAIFGQGGLPQLSRLNDQAKREVLAKEFWQAHVTIAGLTDDPKLAAKHWRPATLTGVPASISAIRQQRVNKLIRTLKN